MARVDVAVDLRRRERGVAEELLDRAEIGAALEQMGGERMPQAMRVGNDPTQRAHVEPAPACGEEEGFFRAGGQRRPRLAQVACEPECCLLAERDDPLTSALGAAD